MRAGADACSDLDEFKVMVNGFAGGHSHVLPGLDDGPLDLDAALEMARGMVESGVRVVCATPQLSGPVSGVRPSGADLEALILAYLASSRRSRSVSFSQTASGRSATAADTRCCRIG